MVSFLARVCVAWYNIALRYLGVVSQIYSVKKVENIRKWTNKSKGKCSNRRADSESWVMQRRGYHAVWLLAHTTSESNFLRVKPFDEYYWVFGRMFCTIYSSHALGDMKMMPHQTHLHSGTQRRDFITRDSPLTNVCTLERTTIATRTYSGHGQTASTQWVCTSYHIQYSSKEHGYGGKVHDYIHDYVRMSGKKPFSPGTAAGLRLGVGASDSSARGVWATICKKRERKREGREKKRSANHNSKIFFKGMGTNRHSDTALCNMHKPQIYSNLRTNHSRKYIAPTQTKLLRWRTDSFTLQ